MKLGFALLLVLVLVAPALAVGPPLPVTSFAQIENPQPIGQAECPASGVMFALDFEKDGTTYRIFVGANGTRFVMLDKALGDATAVWIGSIAKDNTLTVSEQLTYGVLKVRYPNPCDAFGTTT